MNLECIINIMKYFSINIIYFSGLLDGKLLNGKAVKEYFKEHNLPMKVILSQDATSIVGKRSYANKSDSVTGPD